MPAKANIFSGLENLEKSPISPMMEAASVVPIPGIVQIGGWDLSRISLISSSTSLISSLRFLIRLMVCLNSYDFASDILPILFLVVSRKRTAKSSP